MRLQSIDTDTHYWQANRLMIDLNAEIVRMPSNTLADRRAIKVKRTEIKRLRALVATYNAKIYRAGYRRENHLPLGDA